MRDPSDAIDEHRYAGLVPLGCGAALLFTHMYFIDGRQLALEDGFPDPLYSLGMTVGALLYGIGFWRVTRAKGYHPVLFLLVLTSVVGFIVLMVLPAVGRSDRQAAEQTLVGG